MPFDGFPADTIRFLTELAKNNNRPWFLANKARYERSVRAPALAFIEAMAPRLERISPHIYADASPVGGSLMRIYRDTRFSNDKAPYKTNIGIQFRHERGEDAHAPVLYLHIEPKGCFLACGIWRPDGETLTRIRTRIASEPDEWKKARNNRAFVKAWGSVTGDRLTRPPRGFDPDLPCAEDLKLKDFLGVVDLSRSQIASAKLLDHVVQAFAAGSSLMTFLCKALSLPY